jgi:hypothetical protein
MGIEAPVVVVVVVVLLLLLLLPPGLLRVRGSLEVVVAAGLLFWLVCRAFWFPLWWSFLWIILVVDPLFFFSGVLAAQPPGGIVNVCCSPILGMATSAATSV